MRRPIRTPILSLLLAGCAGILEVGGVDVRARDRAAVPASRGAATALGVDSMPRRVGPAVGRPGELAGATAGAVGAGRRVCRGEQPSGWVAVAYLAAEDCPRRAGGDASASAAIVVPLAGRPLDAVLDVCADVRVPRQWRVETRGADASDRCPGAAADGRSATMRIRRVR